MRTGNNLDIIIKSASFAALLGFALCYSGVWNLMQKGAILRTQYSSLKLGKGRIYATNFWPQFSNLCIQFWTGSTAPVGDVSLSAAMVPGVTTIQ